MLYPFFDGQVFVAMKGVKTYYTRKGCCLRTTIDLLTAISLGDYLLPNGFILLDIFNHNRNTPVFSTFQVDMLKPVMKFNGTIFEMRR